ncbi:MAG: NAD-dependent epimerase/dehydratase family protein, partial [Solobacterium sp.]|nr:NAD-dependent epimerase/dehydratase family protein [Solobacterium sp.]
MRVLVTGAKGFIGKNLCLFLKQSGFDVCEYDLDYEGTLQDAVQGCSFVMHLAGVNRPKNEEEYVTGNAGLTEELVRVLKEDGRKLPLLVSSSVQAERDNPYGRSKKAAE